MKHDLSHPTPRQDIFEILKACKRYGVKTIKVASLGLEVEFSDNINENKGKKLSLDQELRLSRVSQEEILRERELKMSIMDIEDPAAYEQMLLSGGEKEFLEDAKVNDIRPQ